MVNKKGEGIGIEWYFLAVMIVLVIFAIYFTFFLPDANVIKAGDNTPPISDGININKTLYPNPIFTTGEVITKDKNVICKNYILPTISETTKQKVFKDYNFIYPPQISGSYQIDALVPLELGGSTNPSNLWVIQTPYSKYKKSLVDYYVPRVCTGLISLNDAQVVFVDDWFSAYLKMINTSPNATLIVKPVVKNGTRAG